MRHNRSLPEEAPYPESAAVPQGGGGGGGGGGLIGLSLPPPRRFPSNIVCNSVNLPH